MRWPRPVAVRGRGQDDAFEIIYARLKSDKLLLTLERPAVSTLLRDHPYALRRFQYGAAAVAFHQRQG